MRKSFFECWITEGHALKRWSHSPCRSSVCPCVRVSVCPCVSVSEPSWSHSPCRVLCLCVCPGLHYRLLTLCRAPTDRVCICLLSVCMHICMHVYTRTRHIYLSLYLHTHSHVHTWTHIAEASRGTQGLIYACIYACIYTHTYAPFSHSCVHTQ